ncbi:MAG: hypothetical protein JW986_06665 [Methanotrichaceae archaeon]|nr:hypothetical protein [Methanotrichaceae archaeon]
MIRWALLTILLLSLALPGGAYPYDYMYRYPEPTVMISSKVSPEVLMAGDSGIVSIEIENCADQYVISFQNEDFSFSMPIYLVQMNGTDEIEVMTGPYENIGSIGPGDKITVYFNVQSSKEIDDGTHFLDVKLIGGYVEAPKEINRRIPIKVDSSDVMLIQSEAASDSGVSLDVANPRQNALNAVTIVPEGRGVEFSPQEYYIGTMEPDEIFTIDFDMNSISSDRTADPVKNLSFKARFKNGDTWHESEVYTITAQRTMEGTTGDRTRPANNTSGMGTTTVVTAAILLPTMIGGAYFWHKRRAKP